MDELSRTAKQGGQCWCPDCVVRATGERGAQAEQVGQDPQQLIELVQAGRSPEALAKEFEPSAQTIRNWAVQVTKLRRENRQLRLERDILAKGAAWFAKETGTIPSGSTGS